MKIMIDGRPSMGGVDRYTRELHRLLSGELPDDALFMYAAASGTTREGTGHRSDFHRWPLPLAGLARRIVTDQLLLPLAAAREEVDVFHSTNYLVPPLLRCPCVVTCYDLWLCDEVRSKKRGVARYYDRHCLNDGLRRASHVITPSETVAEKVRERFNLPSTGVSAVYPPLPLLAGRLSPAGGGGSPQPYFLTVGTIEPRKNLSLLLKAHHAAFEKCGVPLYLVGTYGWGEKDLLRKIRSSGRSVRWLGKVDDARLAELYRDATAVVQFSLEEGFDYPVAEAMSFGTPLLVSDIAVHREVAGDCALYAPPESADALTAALLQSCELSGEERRAHRRRARQRVAEIEARSGPGRYISIYRGITQSESRRGL